MLGIVGDSAAGKTTLTRGIVNVFGVERVTAVCVDDYHRYDREQRKKLTITPLNPECNYIGIMEQHLRLLAGESRSPSLFTVTVTEHSKLPSSSSRAT